MFSLFIASELLGGSSPSSPSLRLVYRIFIS